MDAAAWLGAATARLAAAGIDSARLDAEVLLAHALGVGRAGVFARLGDAVDADAAARAEALLARRAAREPVAYLTGTQEFWSLPFAVTPDVLIPRPETELLVELAVRFLRSPQPDRLPAGEGTVTGSALLDRSPLPQGEGQGEGIPTPAILDLGTGSGCLAVALARELPAAQVTAVDLSPAALAVARRNAAAHGVGGRIAFVASDLFAALPAAARFDVIVSNPPYLAPGDAVSPELAHEPRGALYAGADGLAVIRPLLAGAAPRLRPGGVLLMELGQGQADAVQALARAAGFAAARVDADLAGIPRALVAQRA